MKWHESIQVKSFVQIESACVLNFSLMILIKTISKILGFEFGTTFFLKSERNAVANSQCCSILLIFLLECYRKSKSLFSWLGQGANLVASPRWRCIGNVCWQAVGKMTKVTKINDQIIMIHTFLTSCCPYCQIAKICNLMWSNR